MSHNSWPRASVLRYGGFLLWHFAGMSGALRAKIVPPPLGALAWSLPGNSCAMRWHGCCTSTMRAMHLAWFSQGARCVPRHWHATCTYLARPGPDSWHESCRYPNTHWHALCPASWHDPCTCCAAQRPCCAAQDWFNHSSTGLAQPLGLYPHTHTKVVQPLIHQLSKKD